MSWHIYAWLDNGRPHLQVTQAGSQEPALDWICNDDAPAIDRCELKRLFRELILLTCKQEASNIRLFELGA